MRGFGGPPVGGQRAFALDQTTPDIVGDSSDDDLDRLVVGNEHTTVAGILIKAIGALITRQIHVGDHVQEQTRMLARRQRHIEQVNAWRRLVDDALQRTLERPQTDDFEVPQIRDRLGALGVLHPRLPERGCEIRLNRNVIGLVVHRLVCVRAPGQEG